MSTGRSVDTRQSLTRSLDHEESPPSCPSELHPSIHPSPSLTRTYAITRSSAGSETYRLAKKNIRETFKKVSGHAAMEYNALFFMISDLGFVGLLSFPDRAASQMKNCRAPIGHSHSNRPFFSSFRRQSRVKKVSGAQWCMPLPLSHSQIASFSVR